MASIDFLGQVPGPMSGSLFDRSWRRPGPQDVTWAPSHPSVPGLLQLLSNREPDMGPGTWPRKSIDAMWLHLTV